MNRGMRGGRRKNTGRKKREKRLKMPRVEFDMDAIEEIKKRKRGLSKKLSNRNGVS
jgi:hypothetical protein